MITTPVASVLKNYDSGICLKPKLEATANILNYFWIQAAV